MASNAFPAKPGAAFSQARASSEPLSVWQTICLILKPFASLWVTVFLFFSLVFLVFVGTLAQADETMQDAMSRYFHSYFVWIEFKTFFPKSFFPGMQGIPGVIGFPFLGAGTIGIMMLINLGAAHLIRFKIQARGARLLIGLGVTLFGLALTAFVILMGHNKQGLQGVPWFVEQFGWVSVWWGIKAGLWPLLIAAAAGGAMAYRLVDRKTIEFILMSVLAGAMLIVGIVFWAIIPGFRLDDSALRIVWQLMQGTLAGLVLLAGCIMVFKQRGGIVVMHAGVALLIAGMMYVALYAVEEQMSIVEGQTQNQAMDIRKVELTITDPANDEFDDVIAVPQTMLPRGKRFFAQRPAMRRHFASVLAEFRLARAQAGRKDAPPHRASACRPLPASEK